MKSLLLGFLALTVASCSSLGLRDESARFNRFLDVEFEKKLMRSPQGLTNFGRKERYHELNDYSEAFAIARHHYDQQLLKELEKFDRDALDEQTKLTYDLAKRAVEEDIADFEWRDYRYPVNQHGGTHTWLPTFMITKHRVDTLSDLEAYISRLRAFPRVFNEVSDQIRRSQAKGIVPPKFVFAPVFEASRNVVTGRPFTDSDSDSPLYADFVRKLENLNLPANLKAKFKAEGERALLEAVKPAYETLLATMTELEKVANNDAGAWKFPRGDEYYDHRLRMITTTNLTADQIHDIGLKEVARLRAEMEAVKRRLGFKGSLQSFFVHMRNDPRQYYPNTEGGRLAYLKLAQSYRDFISTRIPEYFRLVPKTPFEIRPVEKFRENAAGKAFYDRPSDDGVRPGAYYVNLRDMRDVPKFEAEALLYHEGIPGHHFQIALTIEMKNLPKFRRYNGYTAFSEGWGLYTERLAKEMGGYRDAHSELGRLSMEMLRACRLVVDTGIHRKKWTREKALAYFNENLPTSGGAQTEQIERYIVMPGQATAYMVGMLKILDLREQAKAKLGEKFDIRDFHDVVLGNGPVPLDVLERLVNDYVASRST